MNCWNCSLREHLGSGCESSGPEDKGWWDIRSVRVSQIIKDLSSPTDAKRELCCLCHATSCTREPRLLLSDSYVDFRACTLASILAIRHPETAQRIVLDVDFKIWHQTPHTAQGFELLLLYNHAWWTTSHNHNAFCQRTTHLNDTGMKAEASLRLQDLHKKTRK